VIVPFVDIAGIVDHRCLSFLFIMYIFIVFQDLYLYQTAVSKTFLDKELYGQPLSLSSDLLNYLQERLLENSLLGHSVIQSIYACSKHSQYKKNNENLQGLYIKAINHLLDKITNSYQKHTEETSERVEKVYKLLSLYDPEQYQHYLPIRELFARFYELSVVDNPVIDRNNVLSVIIGRENSYLVEEYCKVEYDLEIKYLLSTTSCHGDELSDDQKCLLSLVNQKDKKHQMRVLFLMCIKKEQHFLKLVIVSFIFSFLHLKLDFRYGYCQQIFILPTQSVPFISNV
jgi:hypothetical protein